jgi:hypothetical protein
MRYGERGMGMGCSGAGEAWTRGVDACGGLVVELRQPCRVCGTGQLGKELHCLHKFLGERDWSLVIVFYPVLSFIHSRKYIYRDEKSLERGRA